MVSTIVSEELLSVTNLRTSFFTEDGIVKAVDDVSFEINKGETVALVGESGCGKSVTALSVMRLISWPPGKIVGGNIIFKNESILEKSESDMQRIRGNQISMIFQEPRGSLNPVLTVGEQIAESFILHQYLSKNQAMERAIDMLHVTGIASPEKRAYEYPHQLSGGMCQRVMIAIALACSPQLLIADEPTTALDVTIQAQILDLISNLRREHELSLLLITHNMGIVAEMAHKVIVMYAGQIVETADVVELFEEPLHPYTEGLLKSIPRLDWGDDKLHVIPGTVPNPISLPPGCYFNPRCRYATSRCCETKPPFTEIDHTRSVRCWLYA